MSNYRNGREGSDAEFSAAFKALGHPHRLAIVRRLLGRALQCCSAEREQDCVLDPASCNVGELAEGLSIAPSTVSHHLKELAAAGLIERVRDGRYLYCRANEARLSILRQFLESGAADVGTSNDRAEFTEGTATDESTRSKVEAA